MREDVEDNQEYRMIDSAEYTLDNRQWVAQRFDPTLYHKGSFSPYSSSYVDRPTNWRELARVQC